MKPTSHLRPVALLVAAVSALSAAVIASPPHVARATSPYRYFFQWYDIASPGMTNDNIHIVNPDPSQTANVSLRMPNEPVQSAAIAARQERLFNWPWPAIGGPVEVDSDIPITVSQRVTYFRSFNEIPALRDSDARTSLWFSWYDRASDPGILNDNIHVLNPGANPAHVTIAITGRGYPATLVVPAQGAALANFPWGAIGGPVHVTSDQPILASQRVQYNGSFNEIAGKPDLAASTKLIFNWYDLASPGFTASNIHLINPTSTTAHATVHMPGYADPAPVTIAPSGYAVTGFPYPAIGGPVTITSDVPVLASQRVIYWGAFKEYWALAPSSEAVSDTWFNWYDNASPCFLQNNIHMYGTGPGTSYVTIDVPGIAGDPSITGSVGGGGETLVNFPLGTIGGPVHVHVTSGPPVLLESRTVVCPPPPPAPPPPPTPKPVRLRIPVVGTSAVVEEKGVDASGNLSVPDNIWDVAWFNVMPRPGEPGDAVMTGHVDWYNSGAAFEGLPYIWVGAQIYVDRDDGSTLTFVVDSKNYYPYNSPPASIWTYSGPPQLTLITCDPNSSWTGSGYSQRLVVHANIG
jgi:hypothetical protein